MDDEGVSEVLGAIISFGIVSLLVVVALNGFNIAADRATERAIDEEADAIAQTVAGRVGDLALWAQDQTGQDAHYASHLGLPSDLEGKGYDVSVDGTTGDITIQVAGVDIVRTRTAPGIATLSTHELCDVSSLSAPSVVLVYVDAATLTCGAAEIAWPTAIILRER